MIADITADILGSPQKSSDAAILLVNRVSFAKSARMHVWTLEDLKD